MAGEKPKLRKREIALALGAGALAAGAIAIATGDDDEEYTYVVGGDESEDIVEMTYDLSGFDAVSVNGVQDVQITYGEEFSVRGEGPESVMGQLEVVVEDGMLYIRQGDDGRSFSWDDANGPTFAITMPALSRLNAEGAGDIEVDRITGESFEAVLGGAGEISIDEMEVEKASFRITGAGELTVSGTAGEVDFGISGAGEVSAAGLRAQVADVTISGLGEVDLTVEQQADVQVSGAGEVDIFGPGSCTITDSGLASVSCEGNEG